MHSNVWSFFILIFCFVDDLDYVIVIDHWEGAEASKDLRTLGGHELYWTLPP